ncbi:MAG TPA: M23 family metallopeptidase [Tepidiformaceae bacterium]|nr:M23 family metallopeptidase [Tepidiformaceae bacterium]HNO66157.1 M23 family metallopeptidase [Tepidiformaceae bacterium]
MLSRRRFLTGATCGAVALALGRGQLPTKVGQAEEPEPLPDLPYRIVGAGIAQDGAFPDVRISLTNPYQGGALLVTATNALSGIAEVFGRNYLLSPGPEGLAGFVGVGALDPAGPTTLTVHLNGTLNEPLNYSYTLSVRETQWTFDEVIIPPPDPNEPPPPEEDPPLVDEQPRLNELYAGVSERRWDMPWILPLTLGGDVFISGYFGEERSYNGGPRGGHHGGTDIGAPAGTEIHATNNGLVVLAERTKNRGNLVVLDHGSGIFSCYGHQSALRVTVGDVVHRGDVLGLVGSTGLSTGPHLHWELAVGGVLVDGLRWLDGTQGF